MNIIGDRDKVFDLLTEICDTPGDMYRLWDVLIRFSKIESKWDAVVVGLKNQSIKSASGDNLEDALSNLTEVVGADENLIKRMRLLENSYGPEGYPSVKMMDISALCDLAEKAVYPWKWWRRLIGKR